jgi:hypothetical protein
MRIADRICGFVLFPVIAFALISTAHGGEPPVNAWARRGSTSKGHAGIVYAPTVKGLVRWGSGAKAPLLFDGKWKPMPGTAPAGFKGGLSTDIHNACTWDSKRKALVYAGPKLMLAYDPVKGVWKDYKAQIELYGKKHPGGPPAQYGRAICYDPVNDEIVALSGTMCAGFNDYEKTGRIQGSLGTLVYSYKDNTWRQVAGKLGSAPVRKARAEILDLIIAQTSLTRKGFEAYMQAWRGQAARGAELAKGTAIDQKSVAARVVALTGTVPPAGKVFLTKSAARLKEAGSLLAAGKSKAGYLAQYAGLNALYSARNEALAIEPPGRAHSRMIYDAANKCIVLFGGDGQRLALGDTWVYRCTTRQWERRLPKATPCPRAGHGFAYDSKRKLCVLSGGYLRGDFGQGNKFNTFEEIWTYNVAANQWKRYRSKFQGKSLGWSDKLLYMDYNPETDSLVGVTARGVVLATRFDPAGAEVLPAQKYAFRNVEPLSPELPEPDPAWIARVKALPANTWVNANAKGRPGGRGYTVSGYDPVMDTMLLYGGGHSTWQGNDVQAYFPRANKWVRLNPAFFVNVSPWNKNCVHPSGAALDGGPFTMHSRQNYTGCAGRVFVSDFIGFFGYAYGPEWLLKSCTVTGRKIRSNRTWVLDLADRRWRMLRDQGPPRRTVGYGTYPTQFGMAKDGKVCGGKFDFTVLDPVSGKFTTTKAGNRPPPSAGADGGESFAQVYCEQRNVLFAYGRRGKNGTETWLYDIAKNEWRNLKPKKSPPAKPRRGGQCAGIQIWVPDADLVLAMVKREKLQDHPPFWVYSFKHNTWAPLPVKVQGKKPRNWGTDVWEQMIYSRTLKAFVRTKHGWTWILRPDFSAIDWNKEN